MDSVWASVITGITVALITVGLPYVFGRNKNKSDYASDLTALLDDVTKRLRRAEDRIQELEAQQSAPFRVTVDIDPRPLSVIGAKVTFLPRVDKKTSPAHK